MSCPPFQAIFSVNEESLKQERNLFFLSPFPGAISCFLRALLHQQRVGSIKMGMGSRSELSLFANIAWDDLEMVVVSQPFGLICWPLGLFMLAEGPMHPIYSASGLIHLDKQRRPRGLLAQGGSLCSRKDCTFVDLCPGLSPPPSLLCQHKANWRN